MSVQAIAWVLEDAPDLPPSLVATLIGLANHADRDGRDARPMVGTLAEYARKGVRAVQKDLRELEKLGLIREGDQRAVSHLRPDRRPTVYDLAMERTRSRGVASSSPRKASGGVSRSSGRKGTTGRTTGHPEVPERGEPQDAPPTSHGVNSSTERGELQRQHGVNHSSHAIYKEGTVLRTVREPLLHPHANSIGAVVANLAIEEEEATKVVEFVIAERKPDAPSRYITALIASGDIHQFLAKVRTPAAGNQRGYTGTTHPYADDGGGHCRTCRLPEKNPRHRSA